MVREAEKAREENIDVTPKGFSVRTVAQEYGGGAFSVSGDVVIFANYKDQRLYKQSLSSLGQHHHPPFFDVKSYLTFFNKIKKEK